MDDKKREKFASELEEVRREKKEKKEAALLGLADKYPDSPEVLNEVGMYYKGEKGDDKQALSWFQKAYAQGGEGMSAVCCNMASCYYNLTVSAPQAEQGKYMNLTVKMFEKAAAIDGTGYLYLGNLYVPGRNKPFADDYERAVRYYMQVPKSAGVYWATAMCNIAMYYQAKKDYVAAAGFFSFAVVFNPTDKKVVNYFNAALGRTGRRRHWMKIFKGMQDQREVEQRIRDGREELLHRCPYCKSENTQRIPLIRHVARLVAGQSFFKKERHYNNYRCNDCKKEW